MSGAHPDKVVDALEFGQQAQVVQLNPTQNVAEGDTEFHKLKALLAQAEDHKKEMATELEQLREQVRLAGVDEQIKNLQVRNGCILLYYSIPVQSY